MFWKTKTATKPSGFLTPWPKTKPHVELSSENAFGRPAAGLAELLTKAPLKRGGHLTILEVGVELGGSTRLFLKTFPNAKIYSIDPWINNYPLPADWAKTLQPYADKNKGSLIGIFQSYNWNDRERVNMLRSWSHDGLRNAFSMELKPDLIYIDGDHRYHGVLADLFLSFALFPKARILGDDWNFAPAAKKYKGIQYPVRTAAVDFADHVERKLVNEQNSYWIIS